MKRLSLTLLVCIAFVGVASAHDPGLSSVMVKTVSDRVEVSATFSRKDIEALLAMQGGVALKQTNLSQLALETVRIQQNGQALKPTTHEINFPGEDNVEVRLTFNSGTGKITFSSLLLERFAPGHRQLLSVTDVKGQVLAERLLSASVGAADLEIQPAQPSVPETSIRAFVLLGVEHILTGYDHLLFLFALLIVARSSWPRSKLLRASPPPIQSR